MKINQTKNFKQRVVALAVASALSLAPALSEAAGLGRMSVFSGLGQPLRAELEVSATKAELAELSARLAPQTAFMAAGVDFSPVLMDISFKLDTRSNGKTVIKLSTSKPVNEPFLDFLVELNWASGRLVREYTFLLDPPEGVVRSSARPVSVAEAKVVDALPAVSSEPEARPAPVASTPPPTVVRQRPAPVTPTKPRSGAVEPAAGAAGYQVKAGDTLRKIAESNRVDGVSLEQMLVGIFNANPDAFAGNINRLHTGKILTIPDASTAAALSQDEAIKVIRAQAKDWNAYRQKLAASVTTLPAKAEAPVEQSAAGKITPKVEDKTPAADANKDQVKVSRSEAAKAGAKPAKSATEEEAVARARELKETTERLVLLEKNVQDLQQLLELKSKQLAEVQEKTIAKGSASAPAKPVEPPKPTEAPRPAEPPVVQKPAEPPAPTEPPKPAEPAPKPAAEKPAEAPKPPAPKPVAPPPVEEPSVVDSLLADPVPLAAGGGVLALLLGLVAMRRRKAAAASSGETTTAGPVSSGSGARSMFGVTGGQSIDTSNTPPQTGEFSQTGPGTIDTDEVDPVAEADVYMAYGRDAQAEEILLEALQKDPSRIAIHAKLLEIYANRNSLKQFETLASELYAQTGGEGPEWEKAAALGKRMDPGNPLYGKGQDAAAAPAFDAEATIVVRPEKAAGLGTAAAVAAEALSAEPLVPLGEPVLAVEAPAEPATDDSGLDFDLGSLSPSTEAVALTVDTEAEISVEEPESPSEPAAASTVLDFDIGEFGAPASAEPVVAVEEVPVSSTELASDFAAELAEMPESLSEPHEGEPTLSIEAEPEPAGDNDIALDFDMGSLPESPSPDFTPEGTMVLPTAMAMEEPEAVDLDISLDIPAETVDAPVAAPGDAEETATDLDFDLAFGEPAAEAVATETTAAPPDVVEALEATVPSDEGVEAPSSFDLSSINLDLSVEPEPFEPEPPGQGALESVDTDAMEFGSDDGLGDAGDLSADDPAREEIRTKLDLAKAYEEMGDLEGARELLNEVIADGAADLADQAREVLARIG